MKASFVVLALCALFAVSMAQDAQSAVAPAAESRFAETESEDAAVLAAQEQEFEDALDTDEEEEAADEETEEADEEGEEAEEETEEESEDEAAEESDVEEESEDAAEDETEEDAEEDAEVADEFEDEGEEEAEDEGADDGFVLAELQENPTFTGFMQMTAEFVPVEAEEAEHLVHSLSSHQQALAAQEYSVGYAHGVAAAAAPAPQDVEESEDEEEAEDGEEAAFVEGQATAKGSPRPVYGFPGQFPNGIAYSMESTGHAFAARPYYTSVAPPPPPVPTWLPPPPYVPPVPAAGGKDD